MKTSTTWTGRLVGARSLTGNLYRLPPRSSVVVPTRLDKNGDGEARIDQMCVDLFGERLYTDVVGAV